MHHILHPADNRHKTMTKQDKTHKTYHIYLQLSSFTRENKHGTDTVAFLVCFCIAFFVMIFC